MSTPAGSPAARELWIATGNEKKRVELERLLAGSDVSLRLMAELDQAPELIEDAPDFAGNAEIKASGLARVVGQSAVGDDSGLCVEALDGQPGVRSARWAGPGASDGDRNDKLLRSLAGRPAAERGAYFVCSICLAGPDGRPVARFEGRCAGRILEAPRGEGGFGYDPVFEPQTQPGRSFAELSPAEKDRISHRGLALRQLADYLAAHGIPQ